MLLAFGSSIPRFQGNWTISLLKSQKSTWNGLSRSPRPSLDHLDHAPAFLDHHAAISDHPSANPDHIPRESFTGSPKPEHGREGGKGSIISPRTMVECLWLCVATPKYCSEPLRLDLAVECSMLCGRLRGLLGRLYERLW
jgi:hypothetical protein